MIPSFSFSLKMDSDCCDFLHLFRVLTLWFDYGHWPDVNEALVEGIKTIQIDTWLQVEKKYTHLLKETTLLNLLYVCCQTNSDRFFCS